MPRSAILFPQFRFDATFAANLGHLCKSVNFSIKTFPPRSTVSSSSCWLRRITTRLMTDSPDFFLPSGLRPSRLSDLPVDLRVHVLQWQRLDVVLEWREEDDSGTEVIRRSTSLVYPDLITLSTHVCLFVQLVSTSSGQMPRLRVSTVSHYSLLYSSCLQ